MGRETKKLDRSITVRMLPEELELIRAAARASGMTVSGFFRYAIDKKLSEATQ